MQENDRLSPNPTPTKRHKKGRKKSGLRYGLVAEQLSAS
jgi:hypothetical protein